MSSTLKLLDIAGCPNAFKGSSGRLHKNSCSDLETAERRVIVPDKKKAMKKLMGMACQTSPT
jgi:hypothetical protein